MASAARQDGNHANRANEVLWFSPHCVTPDRQGELWRPCDRPSSRPCRHRDRPRCGPSDQRRGHPRPVGRLASRMARQTPRAGDRPTSCSPSPSTATSSTPPPPVPSVTAAPSATRAPKRDAQRSTESGAVPGPAADGCGSGNAPPRSRRCSPMATGTRPARSPQHINGHLSTVHRSLVGLVSAGVLDVEKRHPPPTTD